MLICVWILWSTVRLIQTGAFQSGGASFQLRRLKSPADPAASQGLLQTYTLPLRKGRKVETLYCQSELPHLCSCVVTGQTLVNPLVPQSHWLHLQHLAIFQKLHMGISITGQNPDEGERNDGSNQYYRLSLLQVVLNVPSICCTYSPSRLHSTLGAGRPLTRQWNSASWPIATVSSCIWDVPEITGGAGTVCTRSR